MPDSPEVSVHNPTQEVQAQAERLERMTSDEVTREIRDEAADERLRTRAEEVEVLASSLMSLDGDPEDPTSNKGKAREVLSSAQKILIAVRQGKIALPTSLDSGSQEFVRGALSSIASSLDPEALDEKSGAFVYTFLSKLVNGETPNVDVLMREMQSLGRLSQISPRIFQKTSEAVFQVAQNEGLTPEQITERYAPEQETIPEVNSGKQEEWHAGEADPLTQEESQELDSLVNKIDQAKLSPAMAGLGVDDQAKVRDAFNFFEPLEGIVDQLNKIGVSVEDAQRYQELAQRHLNSGSTTGMGGRMTNPHLEKKLSLASQEFAPEEVIRKYLTRKEDGSYEMTIENRKAFRKSLTHYYYELFGEFDKNPSQLFDKMYDFYTHSPYINGLRGLLTEVVQSTEINKLLGNNADSKDFLQGMINYSHSMYNYSQLFHDLPIYALDAGTHEQWKNFIAQLYPSELATFFDDPIMEAARSEITRYIKMRIALNNNRLPEDIFDAKYERGEAIYAFKDQDKLTENLKKRLNDMDVSFEDWEVSRALSYGRGIGLLTLQDVETMGLGDANPTFKSMPDIIAKLWQRHKWGQGRGGTEILHTPEILTMDVLHNPEAKSRWSKIRPFAKKRKWVPQSVYDYAKKKTGELGIELDHKLLDRKGTYQELMNIFNLGDLITRAGWRIDHLMPGEGKTGSAAGLRLLSSINRRGLNFNEGDMLNKKIEWSPAEWKQFYDAVTENLGSGALWFYADKEVEVETIRALRDTLNKIKPSSTDYQDYDSLKKLYDKYLMDDGAFENIMELADGTKGTLYDYKQQKEWEIKGRLFEYYMGRSPGDFLLNLNLLVPDLLNPDSDLWKIGKTGKDGKPIKQKMKFEQELVYEKWGNGKDRKSIDQLENIKDWYNKLTEEFRAKFVDDPDVQSLSEFPKKQELVLREKIFAYFYQEMGTAFEKVKERGAFEITEADINDPTMRKMVFGDGGQMGLLPLLKSFHGDPGNGVKVDGNNFFYLMGKAWQIKNGKDNPMTSDINFLDIYEDIAKSGQGMTRRLHADLDTWDKVASEVANLPHLLHHVSEVNNFEEIYKLHDAIKSLEGIVGFEETRKANYLIGSLVSQYFWEHSNTRGGFGSIKDMPQRYLLGKKISLSKLHGGMTAYSMNTREVREYFRYLAYDKNNIQQKGRWSYEQAKMSFDAETDRWIMQDVIPSSLLMLVLFMIYRMFKRGVSEMGRGDQKSR